MEGVIDSRAQGNLSFEKTYSRNPLPLKKAYTIIDNKLTIYGNQNLKMKTYENTLSLNNKTGTVVIDDQNFASKTTLLRDIEDYNAQFKQKLNNQKLQPEYTPDKYNIFRHEITPANIQVLFNDSIEKSNIWYNLRDYEKTNLTTSLRVKPPSQLGSMERFPFILGINWKTGTKWQELVPPITTDDKSQYLHDITIQNFQYVTGSIPQYVTYEHLFTGLSTQTDEATENMRKNLAAFDYKGKNVVTQTWSNVVIPLLSEIEQIVMFVISEKLNAQSQIEMDLELNQMFITKKRMFSNYLLQINKNISTSYNSFTTEQMISEHETRINADTKARIFFTIEEMSSPNVAQKMYWNDPNINYGCGMYQAFESEKQTLEFRLMNELVGGQTEFFIDSISHVVKNDVYNMEYDNSFIVVGNQREPKMKVIYSLIPKGRRIATGKALGSVFKQLKQLKRYGTQTNFSIQEIINYYMRFKLIEGRVPDMYVASSIENLYVRPKYNLNFVIDSQKFIQDYNNYASTVNTLDKYQQKFPTENMKLQDSEKILRENYELLNDLMGAIETVADICMLASVYNTRTNKHLQDFEMHYFTTLVINTAKDLFKVLEPQLPANSRNVLTKLQKIIYIVENALRDPKLPYGDEDDINKALGLSIFNETEIRTYMDDQKGKSMLKWDNYRNTVNLGKRQRLR